MASDKPTWGANVRPQDLRNNKEIQIPPQDVTIAQVDRARSWKDVAPLTSQEINAFYAEGTALLAGDVPLDIPAFGVPTLTYLRLVKTILTDRIPRDRG